MVSISRMRLVHLFPSCQIIIRHHSRLCVTNRIVTERHEVWIINIISSWTSIGAYIYKDEINNVFIGFTQRLTNYVTLHCIMMLFLKRISKLSSQCIKYIKQLAVLYLGRYVFLLKHSENTANVHISTHRLRPNQIYIFPLGQINLP